MELIRRERELTEEESKEKLKALELERQFLRKEAEIRRKIADKSETNSSVNEKEEFPTYSEHFYANPNVIDNWVTESRQCIHKDHNQPESFDILSSPNVNVSSFVGGGENNQVLLDIVKQYAQNANATNKVLLQQKLKNLTEFSGDLSDWPIFINEFRRSTDQLELSDEDNLIRLNRALKGKARETVKALLISPRNVSKIIKMLEMNFGRPEWIILSLIEKAKKADIAASRNLQKFFALKQVRTVQNLRLPSQEIDVDNLNEKYPHLDRDLLASIRNAKPELLIGQDNCGLIVPRNVIQPQLHQPIMSQCKLGWTVHGPTSETETYLSHVTLCCRHLNDDKLHEMVKDTFRLEAFGVKIPDNVIKSIEDKRAVEIMEKTLKKVGNHYEIGHLWKRDDLTLPPSKTNALNRLYCMERKMDKDAKFAEEYTAKITEYLQKGYARKLHPSEVQNNKNNWYLPHFGVANINKPGKIRLVFDAAAKSQGVSLNDFLCQGPDYVPSLISVLWRFRQGRIAFGGDIRDMFHRVSIIEEDRCAQLFLWRGMERNQSPDVYEMKAMIFGAISSPSAAQFVKNKNAASFEDKYPGIVRAMEKQHYVDDYLDSCHTIDEAIDRIRNVIVVHKEANFDMVKWISNSNEVMQSIPENFRANSQVDVKLDSKMLERVLGISWSPTTDDFVFILDLKKIPDEICHGEKVPTKREVLRTVMSVFDPLGFLAPLMINARILIQNIWRSHIDWDQAITEELFYTWLKWLTQLKYYTPVTINRYYFPNSTLINKVDLHLFSDASDKAYAAVAFLRMVENDEVHISFLAAKFKVAPMNQQTIPKLELQGAVLACRMAKSIRKELEYEIDKVHFWTDSMVVIHQIRSESRRFPIFVACRLGEIHEDSDLSQWHWLPSELNVADRATKERKDIDLLPGGEWFSGPHFLKLPETDWPEEPRCSNEDNLILLLDVNDSLVLPMDFPNICRFSKFNRLIRSTAWILHFKKVVKITKLSRPTDLILSADEIEDSMKLWIRKCQEETFGEEISILKRKLFLPKSSRLYKLSAFLDEYFILRLGGRIPDTKELDIPFESRNPILLDPKHKFTELLIDKYHQESKHIGLETVVNNLRSKYWIINIRVAVKKIFRNCQECRNRNCKPLSPEMGLLPPERLGAFSFPFSYVGIDFFGPMTVAIGRRVEKRYGVLFTCLTLRAIHIELAASLDTSSAILAIRRFMCRRGQPKEIITDNGTNFVGAERELKKWFQTLDQKKISEEVASKNIIWKFNPPGAPHMGGIWERMIRSIKTALKISLKSINPKEEVLVTLMSEIEYIINSRPLTHISVDPNEPEAITPNHFLLLRPGDVRSFGNVELSSRKQWRIAQALADTYWKRWVIEYRPTLLQRRKWHDKTNPIRIGDIVLIVDEKAPRNQWIIGKIEETFPGKDGVIRVVRIKNKHGTYVRPVTKVCILPVKS
ncbi:uncharacterized protein [Leptinotarsa decemlineata]|uniref:uncharacterized protein n=1 Tax=Leptinotarsa decemlineata TaxID=7539 RepID=UPI003D30CAB6